MSTSGLDLDAYDSKIFREIAQLIKERDPSLNGAQIKKEALDLMEQHVRAVSWLSSRGQDLPDWNRGELEQLEIHATSIARVLNNLSLESKIELYYFFGETRSPDLKRLHQDAKSLSKSLRNGLKKRPKPKKRGRRKDVPLAVLVEEGVTVFEKASGIDIANLPNPRSQQSRDIKHKLYNFIRVYIPRSIRYSSDQDFKALKDRVDEHILKER